MENDENLSGDGCCIFFPEDVDESLIQSLIGRKNLDIFHATRVNDLGNIIKGKCLISLDVDELNSIIDPISNTKEFLMIGEDDINLANTSITILAFPVKRI